MLSVSHDDNVTILEMQDVAKRNTLTGTMIATLRGALRDLPIDTRAVVLRAAPACTVWSAGFDIGSLGPGVDPLVPDSPLMALFHAVRDCRVPVIASIHGSCWGGGTDLALRCDLLVADPTCTLAFTPARIGLAYDTDGLHHVLHRAGLALAMEMFVTGEPVSAARAAQHGLINHLVEPEALAPVTAALAQKIAAMAPLSVQVAKRQLRALAAAIPLAPAVQDAIDAARARVLASDDYRDGVAAFLARRPVTFKGQ